MPGDVIGQIAVCLGGRKIPQESADETMSPQLLIHNDKYQVVAEGVAVVTITELADAVLAWVLCHSLFNALYGKADKALGSYLQKLVLKVDDGVKVPARALKLYARIVPAYSGAK